jgi:hypothetical protein
MLAKHFALEVRDKKVDGVSVEDVFWLDFAFKSAAFD